ncbi:hypothetical protein CGCSCA1_v006387 [Colletotrichum siamense]|nr:hypothetical protein CGCSCA1_v006387 [Colletotrichum siamense]
MAASAHRRPSTAPPPFSPCPSTGQRASEPALEQPGLRRPLSPNQAERHRAPKSDGMILQLPHLHRGAPNTRALRILDRRQHMAAQPFDCSQTRPRKVWMPSVACFLSNAAEDAAVVVDRVRQ